MSESDIQMRCAVDPDDHIRFKDGAEVYIEIRALDAEVYLSPADATRLRDWLTKWIDSRP